VGGAVESGSVGELGTDEAAGGTVVGGLVKDGSVGGTVASALVGDPVEGNDDETGVGF
jgi:hypothetical protein